MLLPTRREIWVHKPVWGPSSFLLCQTATPAEFRDLRYQCNCPPCYSSRSRAHANELCHPFGSKSDPPMSKYRFARFLRDLFDTKTDCFAKSNAIVLVGMMYSDPNNSYFDQWATEMTSSDLKRRLRYSLTHQAMTMIPSNFRSFSGLFYSRLHVFNLRRKGPRLLTRARRSHSIAPSAILGSISEDTDTWCPGFQTDASSEWNGSIPIFAKLHGFIENLVFTGHFHRSMSLTSKFRFGSMSDATKKRPKRLRSLVSLQL